MPRNISFAMTTEQFKNRTKTVTRRKGWKNLKAGDVLMACEKCMGLKPGEKINRLGLIRVLSARREPLSDITDADVILEGFPGCSGYWFVQMFCREMGGKAHQEVTRIEFEYL